MRWLLVSLVVFLGACSVAEAQGGRRTYLPFALRANQATPTATPMPQPSYVIGLVIDPNGAICVTDESTIAAAGLVDNNGRLVAGAVITFAYVYPAASGYYESMSAQATTNTSGGASVTFPVRSVVYNPGGGDAVGFRAYFESRGVTYASQAKALRLLNCA